MFLRTFVVALALLCGYALATTVGPPTTLADLRGAWLGGSEANSEYLRLELDRSGKGILTVQFTAGERAAAYEVLSAHLAEYAIQFELRPKDGTEPIYLRGVVETSGMDLKVGNAEHKWHRKVVLEPEHEVLSRIEAVTKRAREFIVPAQ